MADSQPASTHKATSSTAIGEAGAERLSMSVIWAFSLPRIAFGIMGFLFSTYLMKFSTDVLLIAPAVMGTIIAASRLWDAFSDPLAGYLSDRTNSKFGRRRAWMYGAAVPMGLAMIMMWSPPYILNGVELIVWMAVALLLYETASTAFFVPHGAIGVELTPNYHERTRLYGYSHMIGALGTVLGLIALQTMNMAEDKRSFAFALSCLAGVSVTGIVIWSTKLLPERLDYQGRGGIKVFKSFYDVLRNPHARLLLVVYGIETFGAASVGMLVAYLVEYVIPMKDLWVGLLVVYMVPQVIFTPFWMWAAKRVGKKKIWLFSMSLSAVTFFAIFWVTEAGPMIWILSFMLGFASGSGTVVAPAIQADVIDYDEYLSGERKEGVYLAVWNLVRKSAGSLTALVVGFGLQLSGFEPNVEQTEQAKFAIRAMFGLLPAAGYVIGALLFLRFSLNEAEHAEIRQSIAARKSPLK